MNTYTPAPAERERRVGQARVVEHGRAQVQRRAEPLARLGVRVVEAVDEHLQKVGQGKFLDRLKTSKGNFNSGTRAGK